MDTIELVGIIIGILFFLLFLTGSIISLLENETRAARRMFFTAIFLALLFIAPMLIPLPHNGLILTLLFLATLVASIILLIPTRQKYILKIPTKQIDERDIMFSRNELKSGTEKFENYYARNPQNKKLDEQFRNRPGLVSQQSTYYDAFQFGSTEASFKTVEIFRQMVNAKPSSGKKKVNSDNITTYIKNWVKEIGAVSVGVTELKDYHKYSHIGRGNNYGSKVELTHKYAIAFTVEMDKEMLDMAPAGPIVMESAQEYLKVGTIGIQLAKFIGELGYEARAHIDGNYNIVCPLVARDAGLGEIGRMGLLMTPELGPRVRIAVVTTDIPLNIDVPLRDSSMEYFCGICKKCANACPSKAISFDDKTEINGVKRWQINSEKCFTLWSQIGTDCGRCLSVCPYSHPNNVMHNFVRWGIRNSKFFANFALKMDDIFYGRIPEAQPVKEWMKYKN